MRCRPGCVAAVMSVVAVVATGFAPPAAASARVGEELRIGGPRAVTYGDTVRVTGRLLRDGEPVAGTQLVLDRSRDGVTWRETLTADTNARGRVHADVALVRNRLLRWRLTAATTPEVTSQSLLVVVAPRVKATLDRRDIFVGESGRLRGSVRPFDRGDEVRLEGRRDEQWRQLDSDRVGERGRFTFIIEPRHGEGKLRYRVVRPADADHGDGKSPLRELSVVRPDLVATYEVAFDGDLVANRTGFRRHVAQTFADPRGWRRAGVRFVRVPRSESSDFTVVLAEARLVATYHPICSVYWSCRVGRYVIINQDRWRGGTSTWPRSRTAYRHMVVNHETGHWLGHGHRGCPRPGAKAPVMMQQSKGLDGCTANPWPKASELPQTQARDHATRA